MSGRIYTDVVSVGDISVYNVVSDPNGSLSAAQGSLAIRSDVPETYQNVSGGNQWALIGVGAATDVLMNTLTGTIFVSSDLGNNPPYLVGVGTTFLQNVSDYNVFFTADSIAYDPGSLTDGVGTVGILSTDGALNSFVSVAPFMMSLTPSIFPVSSVMCRIPDLSDMDFMVGFGAVISLDPANNHAMFQFSPAPNRGDTTFQLAMKDSGPQTLIDTGIVPSSSNVYDFRIQFNFDGSMTATIYLIKAGAALPARTVLWTQTISSGQPTTAAALVFLPVVRVAATVAAVKRLWFFNGRYAVRIGGGI